MKRFLYRNMILKDNRLPFIIEISRSLTVYYYKNNSLRKADVLVHEIGWLSISINDHLIIIKGINKEKKLVYDIYCNGEKL